MTSQIFETLAEIEKERGSSADAIVDAMKEALESAYKKNFGENAVIEARIDVNSGKIGIYVKKTVVENVEDEDTEISLDKAQDIDKSYNIGDVVEFESTPDDFGRVSAQTAKHIISQKIRDLERDKLFSQFSRYSNGLLSAVVRGISNKNVLLELADNETILPPSEQVKTDKYAVGKRYKVYVIEVTSSSKGINLVVSRSHPELVRKLFELEVPELKTGVVEIKAIAREAGSHCKIAVFSNDPNVDAVGTCIGARGARAQSVMDELRNEKIDIIKYSDDPAAFVSEALKPAKVDSAEIDENNKLCMVKVPANHLSLAIGKSGQNVRLAAKLTGWRIDISASNGQFF
jgi:N utilization substance protein A